MVVDAQHLVATTIFHDRDRSHYTLVIIDDILGPLGADQMQMGGHREDQDQRCHGPPPRKKTIVGQ